MYSLNQEIKEFGLNKGYTPVESYGLFRAIQDECYMDSRTRIFSERGIRTTFDGLDFDPENIRTQAFAIINEMPVGVISLATIPKVVIMNQKYLVYSENTRTVEVCNFKDVVKQDEFPNFFIVPAWTYIKPELRNTKALQGYHLMREMINKAIEFAPKGTWIEAVAQGHGNKYKFDINLLETGKRYCITDLTFPIEIIAKNTEGSSSSVKFAHHLELTQLENVGSGKSLGPVFVKRVK